MLHAALFTGYRQIYSDFKITAHICLCLLFLFRAHCFSIPLCSYIYLSVSLLLALSLSVFTNFPFSPAVLYLKCCPSFFRAYFFSHWKFSRTGILNILVHCLYALYIRVFIYISAYICIQFTPNVALQGRIPPLGSAVPDTNLAEAQHAGSRLNSHSENARALSFFGGPVKRLITRIRLTVSTFPVSIVRS